MRSLSWQLSVKAILAIAGVLTLGWAGASTLTFTRTDELDVMAGHDLWQNTYTFTGRLEQFGGLTLFFDPATHGVLDVAGAPPEFSVSVNQPDPVLPAAGLVSLTIDAGVPSTYMASFVVTYDRLGMLANGHSYEVFDANFNTVESGQARLAGVVPEPASLPLTILACAGALLATRPRSRARTY